MEGRRHFQSREEEVEKAEDKVEEQEFKITEEEKPEEVEADKPKKSD